MSSSGTSTLSHLRRRLSPRRGLLLILWAFRTGLLLLLWPRSRLSLLLAWLVLLRLGLCLGLGLWWRRIFGRILCRLLLRFALILRRLVRVFGGFCRTRFGSICLRIVAWFILGSGTVVFRCWLRARSRTLWSRTRFASVGLRIVACV